MLLSFNSNHPFNSSLINPYLGSMKLAVTMFFFCILSAVEKIMSSIKQGLQKMFIAIIFCQAQITKFCTHHCKSFPNSKYFAIAFNINFKVAKYTSCISALYMLRNVLIVKLAKLYTVNLYVFLSALYTLQYVPIVIILVIVYFSTKKKKKKNDPYFGMGKNTKVMPQYPTIYLFSWEREGILMSQNLT